MLYGETDAQLVLSCGQFRGYLDCECHLDDIIRWEVGIVYKELIYPRHTSCSKIGIIELKKYQKIEVIEVGN